MVIFHSFLYVYQRVHTISPSENWASLISPKQGVAKKRNVWPPRAKKWPRGIDSLRLSHGIGMFDGYPLVNIQKTMENHHV